MEQLPKFKEFKAPEGYFEQLPDRILEKASAKKSNPWIKYAAAAALVLSFGWWQWSSVSNQNEQLSLEEEAILYIESNQWTAEDVLSMAEDPNSILDQIIEEELPEEGLFYIEEENWF
ncbi:MAG: hypothetical protein EP311_09345 [Cytophagales bacterium]|uniref:Uncharacterized protein n=1 Tax=Algoriphagus taiwanensis TaxID=1445656 RepID=A0ABQ6Q4P3_9BACT|nr:MAG: hypothetical protein EP311_09345 [Cytophagales bacterium]GMQ35076.1 hypothetical protein Ataiwa_33490 [Algoriphagus taiwanensis]